MLRNIRVVLFCYWFIYIQYEQCPDISSFCSVSDVLSADKLQYYLTNCWFVQQPVCYLLLPFVHIFTNFFLIFRGLLENWFCFYYFKIIICVCFCVLLIIFLSSSISSTANVYKSVSSPILLNLFLSFSIVFYWFNSECYVLMFFSQSWRLVDKSFLGAYYTGFGFLFCFNL